MALATPRTWVVGEVVTAAQLNSEIRDQFNVLIAGLLMDWTALADIGTFQSGFTATASHPPRMRKINDSGTEIWELEGSIDTPSITLGASKILFIFGSGYRVSTTRIFSQGGNSSGFYDFWVSFSATGELNAGLPAAAASAAGTRVLLDGIRITNP